MNNATKSIISFTLVSLLAACSASASPSNLDTQIQMAIAQTTTAEVTFQSAVNQAVEATVVAMPSTPTPQPTVDPYTLTEEELAALIDSSCEDAVAAFTEASSANTQATSDGTYTEDEIYNTIYYVYDAETAIAYTQDLINMYYNLYGEYASESLDLLYAVENDLNDLSTTMTEIEAILSQGAQTASAAIEQLNTTLETVQAKAGEMQTKAQEFKNKLPEVLDQRENNFANRVPTEVASDRDGAILQVYTYLDSIKTAFEDRKISSTEMGQIAQLAANAKASINQSGGPRLQGFSGNIDAITRNLSRGDWPSAQRDIGGFEASLPSRPARR
jgi:hypothetical protein